MSRNWLVARLRGGSGIVELVRESRGKLSQRSQAVALLLAASGFADSIGHQPDQALGQLRHLLHKFGKKRGGKTQNARIREGAHANRKLLHSGKGQHAGDAAGRYRNTAVSPPISPRA